VKHKIIRIVLVVAEAFVGMGAVIGGWALVTGAIPFISFPLALLQGTPFTDYTIPGLALLILVGGSSLFAAATILTGREVGVLASAVAGLIAMGFEVVEVVSVESKWGNLLAMAATQQITIFVLGLAIFGLAAYLWRAEYRSHSFLIRHVSHA
jgi:hypothetical protein